MNAISIFTGICLVFFVFALTELLGLSTPLSMIITGAIIVHVGLFLPKWLVTPVLRRIKLGNKEFDYLFAGLAGIFIAGLSIETRSSVEHLALAIGIAIILALSLASTFAVNSVLNTTLSPFDTTTIVPQKKVTNPKRWTARLIYFERTILVSLSALVSATIALNGSLMALLPAVLCAAALALISNGLILKTILSAGFRERINVQREKYVNSIKSSLNKTKPTTLLYHSGPATPALNDAIAMLKKAKKKFFIIVREKPAFTSLKKSKVEQLIHCVKLAEIEPFIGDTVKEIYYTNNKAKNVHVIRYYEFKHILINSPENALKKSPSHGMFTHRIVKTSSNKYRVETIEGERKEYKDKLSAIKAIS